MTERPTLYELLPEFRESGDPAVDLQILGDWIEIVEALLRLREYAPLGTVSSRGRDYTIRVNGREYEAPHVHVTLGADNVRIFLGASPSDVEPDNRSDPPYSKVIRNKATRLLLEAYVRAHHSCLLRAWKENGNPLHAPSSALAVTCDIHVAPPIEFIDAPAEGLNASLEDAYNDLHRDDP